ncbi:MAG TPA: heavy metal translocating P-type ATPase [Thermogutta sp.]|nr:heavy metal translocating P-type ATPase [Thermogutta sp.]HPU05008.1 heavy metal translocating P-type ATPase [Thermogutta sp.]
MMEKAEEIFEGKWYAHPRMRNALIAGLLTGAAFSLAHLGIIPDFAEIAIYAVAILLGGYHWSREGIEEFVTEGEIGIEVLMIAATVGSAVLGMWDEAAFLVFLYGTAEGLEEYTYARTRFSIRKLLDLAPKEARVLRDGEEITIPAEELKIGDILVVKPGESIATDGIIIEGRSSINEAPVTGESIPVEKKEGMKVFAATVNQEGALKLKVTATFKDNTLSKMIHLVEESQEQKGKAQLFIEKFGKRYSPLVFLSALLLIVVPSLLGAPVSYWATRAVVFLVAAAPCALVMSTPVAIAAGITRAGRSGVLIKGGICLENLGKIKAVAVDKTGTLTKGEPVVTDVVPLNGEESEVLSLAYNVERYSEHPLAKAIIRKAEESRIRSQEVADFSAIAGYGAKARVGNRVVYVGKEGLFRKLGLESQTIPQIETLRSHGKTVMLVGTETGIDAIVAIRDRIRSEAKEAIDELHRMGIKVIMLTGDNEATARAIAEELGIDEVRADLKPEGKVAAVKMLEEKYGTVAMVGDGINDAPALAQATVGIAMGTAGTDAAIEAADVALMADDLTKVSFAINLGKRARRISLQNIVFSLLILAILIPAALSGVMSVAFAVFVHEASELLAVANGLRMARG